MSENSGDFLQVDAKNCARVLGVKNRMELTTRKKTTAMGMMVALYNWHLEHCRPPVSRVFGKFGVLNRSQCLLIKERAI